MSVLLATSFESGSIDFLNRSGWVTNGMAVTTDRVHVTVDGAGGTYAVNVTGTGTDTATPTLGGDPEFLHCWVEPIDPEVPDPITFVFEQASTAQVTVRFATDGSVQVLRGDEVFGALVGASSGSVMTRSVGHWLSIRVVAEESGTGTVQIAVDGVQVYSVTGDLRATSTDGWTRVRLRAAVGNANHTLDDFVIEDSAGSLLLVPQFAVGLLANGVSSGTLTGTGSTGSARWQNLTPGNDATYNSGATDGAEDRYTVADLTEALGDVLCVVTHTEARASGGIVDMDTLVRSGTTDAYASGIALSSSFAVFSKVLEEDPDTVSPWDATGIDGLVVGVRFGT